MGLATTVYVHIAYDRVFGDVPARITDILYTPHVYGSASCHFPAPALFHSTLCFGTANAVLPEECCYV